MVHACSGSLNGSCGCFDLVVENRDKILRELIKGLWYNLKFLKICCRQGALNLSDCSDLCRVYCLVDKPQGFTSRFAVELTSLSSQNDS